MRTLIGAVAGAVVSMCAWGAHAQITFGELPPISRVDVERYCRILGVSEEQREVVLVLQEGYVQEAAAVLRSARERNEEVIRRRELLEQAGSPNAMQEAKAKAFEIGEEYYIEAFAIQDRLLEDIRSTLDEKQAHAWPRVIRQYRRDLVMEEATDLSWTQVDLIECLEELGIDPDAADLSEMTLRYEVDIDRPLGRLYALMLETVKNRAAILFGGDARDRARIFEEIFENIGQVRTINMRHARTLATRLGPVDRDRFDTLVRRRATPGIYAETPVVQSIRVARGLADLNEEQGAALLSLLAEYEERAAAINDAWALAVDRRDDGLGFEEFEMGAEDDQDVVEARDARVRLDARGLERIELILTAEQWARLQDKGR